MVKQKFPRQLKYDFIKNRQPQKEDKNCGYNVAANLRSNQHNKSFKILIHSRKVYYAFGKKG